MIDTIQHLLWGSIMPYYTDRLHAIYDEHLEQYLQSLGLLVKVKRGQSKCKFCREPITLDNIHAIFPDSGMIHICCSNSNCVVHLSSFLDARGSNPR